MFGISKVVDSILRRCVECTTRQDLRQFATCDDGYVCLRCAKRLSYANYMTGEHQKEFV